MDLNEIGLYIYSLNLATVNIYNRVSVCQIVVVFSVRCVIF